MFLQHKITILRNVSQQRNTESFENSFSLFFFVSLLKKTPKIQTKFPPYSPAVIIPLTNLNLNHITASPTQHRCLRMNNSCLSIGISKENIKYNKPAAMGLTRLPSAENSPERNRQKNYKWENQEQPNICLWPGSYRIQGRAGHPGVLTGHCLSDICTAASRARLGVLFCYGFSIPTKWRQHFNRVPEPMLRGQVLFPAFCNV